MKSKEEIQEIIRCNINNPDIGNKITWHDLFRIFLYATDEIDKLKRDVRELKKILDFLVPDMSNDI